MTGRSRWRAIDGLLLLDKPSGITSNAALQRARRVLQAEKAGHTGTLDPMASGLLPLCFGQAAKFARFLLDADKRYTATVSFGLTTTTGDADGEPVLRRPAVFDAAALHAALERLTGPIEQVPPMYSALKRDGRPLYAYAREGIDLERSPRQVVIHRLELLEFGAADDGTLQAVVDVVCSKGTYIRVLAEDIGAALGCGAHLAALRRTATSGWTLTHAVALADLESLAPGDRQTPGAAATMLLHPRQMVAHLPGLHLTPDLAHRFARGQRLLLQQPIAAGPVAVYQDSTGAAAGDGRCGDDASFLGVAERDGEGVLQPLRLMALGLPEVPAAAAGASPDP